MAFACFGAAIACDLVTQYHLFSGVGWRLCWLIAAPIWGIGLFVVVNRLVAAETYRPASDVMPRWITLFATLGLFSYSTYLMHHFVLLYLNPSLFRYLGIADSAATKILFLPLCYALCWLFFIAIERPCIIKKAHRMPTPAQTAVPIPKLSPALS